MVPAVNPGAEKLKLSVVSGANPQNKTFP